MLSAEDLSPLAVLPMTDGEGNSSRVSAVYTAPPRESFIVALKDIPQILEIPYGHIAPDNPRIKRIELEDYLDDFFFNQEYSVVMGASRPAGSEVSESAVSGRVIDHQLAVW
jgi:hypothetical protein